MGTLKERWKDGRWREGEAETKGEECEEKWVGEVGMQVSSHTIHRRFLRPTLGLECPTSADQSVCRK
jgi:hypothetical protein